MEGGHALARIEPRGARWAGVRSCRDDMLALVASGGMPALRDDDARRWP
jgi:hypothetical protein